ncbi:MAG: tol-pal system-associated acyl-CoA thioesterase [Xanthomonadales bacterium]|nr:tol-pal system-associated acyl-CoA thioesterase [Xanthomonadales bacterium]
MIPFVWKVRVYWEDTDAGGVVYHSQYLNFFERARTEWLRAKGVHQAKIASEDNVLFAIRHMDINFVQAARLDDELEVTVDNVDAGGVRMTFNQEMTRCSDRQQVATAKLTAVCLRADNFKPTRMPKWIRAEIRRAS